MQIFLCNFYLFLFIFTTHFTLKGWGLRTLTPITQGSFILSYIGELITDEEAERREDTYLFNLDLKVGFTLRKDRHESNC